MSTRTPLMAGNWKMTQDHHEAVALVQKLAWELSDAKHDFDNVEVAVIPSFTNIRTVQTLIEGDKLELRYGAQDVSAHESGAYTGEVSPIMLKKLGVTYAWLGTRSAASTTVKTTKPLLRRSPRRSARALFPFCALAKASRSARRVIRFLTPSRRSTAHCRAWLKSRASRSALPMS